MNPPELSIIIPVYNRQHTLPHCIESILHANFQDFEILLVDDGSQDGSQDICLQYTAKEPRIRFISQPHAGVGTARNAGIAQANGNWIAFIDSDDAILPQHLDAIQAAHNTDIDYIMKGTRSGQIDSNGKIRIHPEMHAGMKKIHDKTGNKAIVDFLFGEYNPYRNHIYNCSNKFFKRKIIQEHQIRFRTDVNLGEDQIFSLEYLKHVRHIRIYKERTYVVLKWKTQGANSNQLSKKKRSIENLEFNFQENYKALCEFYHFSESEKVLHYAENYLIERYVRRIFLPFARHAIKTKGSLNEIRAFCQSSLIPLLQEHREHVCRLYRFSVRWRAWCLLHLPFEKAFQLCTLPCHR